MNTKKRNVSFCDYFFGRFEMSQPWEETKGKKNSRVSSLLVLAAASDTPFPRHTPTFSEIKKRLSTFRLYLCLFIQILRCRTNESVLTNQRDDSHTLTNYTQTEARIQTAWASRLTLHKNIINRYSRQTASPCSDSRRYIEVKGICAAVDEAPETTTKSIFNFWRVGEGGWLHRITRDV